MPTRPASSTCVQPRSLRSRVRRCPIVSDAVSCGPLAALFQDSVMGEWNFGYSTLNRLMSATGVSGGFNGASGPGLSP